MPRSHQAMLIVTTLAASWFGMQAVHELGHVSGAWLTGGRVARVVLHPLSISRTDLAENPHPLAVAWAGPIGGILIPLLSWMMAMGCRGRSAWLRAGTALLRFFAGFCLIANGLYLGLGSFGRIGDCGDLLNHGAKLWHLRLFGAATASAGLYLWHGLGPRFGLGRT